MPSNIIDRQNAEFWNELCGTPAARALGIIEPSSENLRRFDEWYMNYYPYVARYVDSEAVKGKKVLEIGLGYGTLGQLLALQGCQYYGLDIAKNPVAMMHYRFSLLGLEGGHRVQVGSALEIPYKDATFEYVYSIGCLHHTGNLSRAVAEVYRVLADGGKAVIMLYNRRSFRRLVHLPRLRFRNRLLHCLQYRNDEAGFARWVRAAYDKNTEGEEAPHTDYVSRAQVRRLFRAFSSVRIESRNCTPLVFFKGRVRIPREKLLNNLGRVLGLDLYITVTK